MDEVKIQQAIEDAIIKMIRNDGVFKLDYAQRIDASGLMMEAYKLVDHNKVLSRVKELLEVELAEKIVNKIITEMGTDVKNLMSNASIRDDLKYFMRKGVDEVLARVKAQA